MCRQCSEKPVYEFTNQRKLCARCFVNWFQKKVLYAIRKFEMIRNGDVVSYDNKSDFTDAVLEDVLKMFAEKGGIELIKVHKPSATPTATPKKTLVKKRRLIASKLTLSDFFAENLLLTNPQSVFSINYLKKSRTSKASEQFQQRQFKFAIPSTLDSEAGEIIQILIRGKEKALKKFKPVDGKIIKPLYLFLDEEVLLYAKLRKLKFKKTKVKKNNIGLFLDDIEKKHPEVKRAIVNGWLKIGN